MIWHRSGDGEPTAVDQGPTLGPVRTISASLFLVLVLSACGGTGADEAAEPAVGAVELAPGSVSAGQIEIDGTTVDYVAVAPAGFKPGDTAPVLLAMPPGGQDLSLTRAIVDGTYAPQALARGWVVVSPAAPDGQLYFRGSETLIPAMMSWIESWVTVEGGRFHMAGISNGGLSAFRLAADQPDRFASIVAFPGFPRNDEDRAALADLTDIPVRMFVGETDTSWVTPMEETLQQLTDLGGDVTLEIMPGEGHVIRGLSDGVRVFDELDAAR